MYLATSSLRERTARNSHTLQECRSRLEALQKPAAIPGTPRPYVARPSIVETIKDRWNEELEGIWRWATGLDQVKIRECVEETVGNVARNLQK